MKTLKKRGGKPPGPITKRTRADRIAFCVSTFSTCRHPEEQIERIMAYAGIGRAHAVKYLNLAKAEVGTCFTAYQTAAATDAFEFLMGVRQDATANYVDRINAQRELRETFQYGASQRMVVSERAAARPAPVAKLEEAVLAEPAALAAAKALEEAFVAGSGAADASTAEKHQEGDAGYGSADTM